MTATQKQPRGAWADLPNPEDVRFDRRLAILYNRGCPLIEIARRHDLTFEDAGAAIRRSRDHDRYLAELYVSGLTLRELSEMFGITKTPIHRALKRAGCTLRNAGTPGKREASLEPQPPKVVQLYKAPPPSHVWCSQCERKVAFAAVSQCSSQFCKAKAVAA